MIKSKYLLVLILHLYNHSDATDNITNNGILTYMNQEDETIITTSRSLNIPIDKVLSIYKQSDIVIEQVINIVKNEIISKDELNKLINNINYNVNTNINIDTVENIAYKSDNLANIINCINIDKTSIF